MSRHYKEVSNGNGTNLTIKTGGLMDSAYISIGKDGKDVMLRGNAQVIGFDTWEDLIGAIDLSKASYRQSDLPFV